MQDDKNVNVNDLELPQSSENVSTDAPVAEVPAQTEPSEADSIESDSKPVTLDTAPLPGDEEEKDYEKSWPKGFKESLRRKEKKLAAVNTELAQTKQRLSELESNFTKSSQQVQGLEKPIRENYASEEEFFNDLYHYNRKIEQHDLQTKQYQSQLDKMRQEFETRHERILSTGIRRYDDFEDIIEPMMSDGFPTNQLMYDAIADSEFSHDILYFLGKHIDLAREVALLPPAKAIKKVAEIEVRFRDRKKQDKTKAPNPVAAVNSQPTRGINPENMSPAEYRKWRESKANK